LRRAGCTRLYSRAGANEGSRVVAVRFTQGGSIRVEFDYSQAGSANYPANELHVKLQVPEGFGQYMSDQAAGELATALFGDCALPARATAFLAAHSIDLAEFAAQVAPKYKQGAVPRTTRVSDDVADRLQSVGMNLEQYGTLKVLDITEVP